MQALSIVLGEKRNAHITALEAENTELKNTNNDLEQRMQHLMGDQEAANCVCDQCKTDIYLSSKTFNETMTTLNLIGWYHTYLVTSNTSVTYYGTCPRCVASLRQNTTHHVIS